MNNFSAKPCARIRSVRFRSYGASLFALFVGGLALLTPRNAPAQLQPLVSGNTEFGLDLYSQIASQPGNFIFSPYSISTCMALTYIGAAGETESQMSSVLGFSTNQSQFASAYGQLDDQLKSVQEDDVSWGVTNEVALNIANALWTQQGFPFLATFLDTVTNNFQANINQADFVTQGPRVTAEINQWVAQQTDGKIQNILPSGAISPQTRLVLANAIYFLGTWSTPFGTALTTNLPFYTAPNAHVVVPMMHQPPPISGVAPAVYNYLASTNCQAIELPYATNQDSMVIFLPAATNGLSQLEAQLSPAFISNTLAQMKMQELEVYLPKFSIGSFLPLSVTLSQMGMPDAFGLGADFAGIDGQEDLHISSVFHKAWIQVTEVGTVAGAATVDVITATVVMNSTPPVFRANHPFLFLIRDTQTGSILFLGRVADPSQITTVPGPPLGIGQSGNNLTLSWPYPSSGWKLLQSSDLTSTNWSQNTSVSNDGTNNFTTIPIGASAKFFRLSQ